MRKLFFVFFIILFRCPDSAMASIPNFLRVFETQGNVDAVYHAMHRVALISSDIRYIGCFIVFIVTSALLSGIGTALQGMIGKGNTNIILLWFLTFFFCGIGYFAFIKPNTDILIRDDTTNQSITVGDVPNYIVLTAGLFNVIEQGLIDIIETSATPDSFKDNPDGVTFNILAKAFDNPINLAGTGDGGEENRIKLDTYIERCFAFEFARPGTTVTLGLINRNTNFLTVMANAANPAIDTGLYYHGGVDVTCADLWAELTVYFNLLTDNHAAVIRYTDEYCRKAGFVDHITGFTGQPKINSCSNKAFQFLRDHIIGANISKNQFFKQIFIARQLHAFAMDGDQNAAVIYSGNFKTGNGLIAGGLMAQEWIPKIKSLMYVTFYCHDAFYGFFLVTTLWKQVLMFIFGGFAFFTVWTVTDAILHQFAMDTAIDLMASIKNGQLGMKSVMLFKHDAMKAYAVFGQYKIWGMILAGFFSGAITKAGASGMSRLGAMQTGAMQNDAEQISAQHTDPAKNASALDGYAGAVPTQALHNEHKFDAMAKARGFDKGTQAQTSLNAIENSGGSLSKAVKSTGESNEFNRQTGVSEQTAFDNVSNQMNKSRGEVMDNNATVATAKKTTEANMFSDISGETTAGVVASAQEIAGQKVNEEIGGAQGSLKAYNAAVKIGFTGSRSNYNGFISQIENMEQYSNAAAIKKMSENHFKGDTPKMLRYISEYNQSQKASEVANLGGNHVDVGERLGKEKAATAQATANYIKAIGQDGHRITASSEKFASASKALWNNIMDSWLSGADMPESQLKTLEYIRKDPVALGRFNEMGASGISRSINSKQEAMNATAITGRDVDDYEMFMGSAANFKMGMNSDGSIHGSYVASKKGSELNDTQSKSVVERDSYSNDIGSKYEKMLQNIATGNVESYAARLAEEINNPSGLEAERIAQAENITQGLNQLLKNEGVTIGRLGGDMSLGFKMKGSGFSTRTSYETSQSSVSDLIRNEIENRLSDVVENAIEKGGNVNTNMENEYNDLISSYVKDTVDTFRHNDAGHYGNSSPVYNLLEFNAPETNMYVPFSEK